MKITNNSAKIYRFSLSVDNNRKVLDLNPTDNEISAKDYAVLSKVVRFKELLGKGTLKVAKQAEQTEQAEQTRSKGK